MLVTEVGLPEDVIELLKRNGNWQSNTQSEQEGCVRHMEEEHVTPEVVGKMAAKAASRPS